MVACAAAAVLAVAAGAFAAMRGPDGGATAPDALPSGPSTTGSLASPTGFTTGSAEASAAGLPPAHPSAGGTAQPHRGPAKNQPAPGRHANASPPRPSNGQSTSGTTSNGAALAPRSPAATRSPAPAVARVGTVRGAGSLCLDLNGAIPMDGNHIQVFTCNGTGAQRWTLNTDGTLRVLGKCAQATADARVRIIRCDNRTTAQWRAAPGNTVVNLATGKCLTDPAAGTRNATPVQVTTCTATPGQRWSLP